MSFNSQGTFEKKANLFSEVVGDYPKGKPENEVLMTDSNATPDKAHEILPDVSPAPPMPTVDLNSEAPAVVVARPPSRLRRPSVVAPLVMPTVVNGAADGVVSIQADGDIAHAVEIIAEIRLVSATILAFVTAALACNALMGGGIAGQLAALSWYVFFAPTVLNSLGSAYARLTAGGMGWWESYQAARATLAAANVEVGMLHGTATVSNPNRAAYGPAWFSTWGGTIAFMAWAAAGIIMAAGLGVVPAIFSHPEFARSGMAPKVAHVAWMFALTGVGMHWLLSVSKRIGDRRVAPVSKVPALLAGLIAGLPFGLMFWAAERVDRVTEVSQMRDTTVIRMRADVQLSEDVRAFDPTMGIWMTSTLVGSNVPATPYGTTDWERARSQRHAASTLPLAERTADMMRFRDTVRRVMLARLMTRMPGQRADSQSVLDALAVEMARAGFTGATAQ